MRGGKRAGGGQDQPNMGILTNQYAKVIVTMIMVVVVNIPFLHV